MNGRIDKRDEQLLERVRRGDESATQQLFEFCLPLLRDRVRRRMPRRLRRKVGESDVIQEAYVAAIGRLAEFQDRGEGSFGGWLVTIIDHKISDQVRRYLGTQKRDVSREVMGGAASNGLDGVDEHPSVSERARRREAVGGALQAIKKLDEQDQMLINLIHFEGQTIADAGELLGVTRDAARMRYSRALVRLRRLMHAGGGERP